MAQFSAENKTLHVPGTVMSVLVKASGFQASLRDSGGWHIVNNA